MKKLIQLLSIFLLTVTAAVAQKGTAESGYWPMGYSGDTWTGEVTAAKEETREITLTYKHGAKTETFTAVLPAEYSVKMKDGTDRVVKVDELIGYKVKIYYMNKTERSADGQKRSVANIFQLKFLPPRQYARKISGAGEGT